MTPIATEDAARSTELGQQLADLQQAASVVSDQIRGTNANFYKHLAELYMWWRGASALEGYLDAEYTKLGKRFKRRISSSINFAPLFWLTWGHDNGLTDDKAGRWSRVLNKLHNLYETEKQYRTDSVPKLQNYIELKGGVDGLVGYGTPAKNVDGGDDEGGNDDDGGDGLSDDDVDDLFANAPARMSTAEISAALFGKAKAFYGAIQAPATIDLNATIPLTSDGMGVVLVRKVGDKYQLIGASSDETLVKPVATQTYLQDYSALPQSIRSIVETISTQCLPKQLQSFYADLQDAGAKSAGGSKVRAVRRLMYRHAKGEFVLSPIRAESGVVTVAKPTQPVLASVSRDVFLSTRSRRALERRLISGRDFNLFVPTNLVVIPAYPHDNVASHAIRVQNEFDTTDFLHLDFWPFYDSVPVPRGQLIADAPKASRNTWRASLGLAWFRKFALEFTSPWALSHGTHIRREHQNVFLLVFDTAGLTVHFVYRAGKFESEKTVDFGGVTPAGKAISVYVLSKDFAVAMQSVADLGLTSAVELVVDADGLAMKFATTAADFRIYIPTCSIDGTRSIKRFKNYEPVPVAPDPFEDYNDQAEGDFDPES